jgi:hypothetical protein
MSKQGLVTGVVNECSRDSSVRDFVGKFAKVGGCAAVVARGSFL